MRRLAGLIALPDGTARPGRISFGGRIEAVAMEATRSRDWILPGPIDLQVNGAGRLNVAGASPDEILALARLLAREGTTAFLAAIITAPLDRIEAADRAIGQTRATIWPMAMARRFWACTWRGRSFRRRAAGCTRDRRSSRRARRSGVRSG